jgi:hypothetical protein
MLNGIFFRRFLFLSRFIRIIVAVNSWFFLIQISYTQTSDISQLREMFGMLRKSAEDSAKMVVNEEIQQQIRTILESRKGSLSLSDSIPGLVILNSENEEICFYQWNIQWRSGRHQFFGYLEVKDKERRNLWPLQERFEHGPASDTVVCGYQDWFGALYYKIIEVSPIQGPSYFTLLGWSGDDQTITRKVIEILRINADGEPVFGGGFFEGYPKPGVKRVVYRFSASATMNLKYENQVISARKIWNKRKRVFETEEIRGMVIVADRVEPMDPLMESMFQFYIPAGDIHDGFMMEAGKWQFHPGIETRNSR